MKLPRLFSLWFAFVIFTPLFAEEKADERFRSVQWPLKHQLSKDVIGSDDLIGMTAAVGVDFPLLVDRALDSDPAAIYLLLWLGANAPLDGAGSEGYGYVMVDVIKRLGDELVAKVAKRLTDEERDRVAAYLIFEYHNPNQNDFWNLTLRDIRADFPSLSEQLNFEKWRENFE